LNPLPVVFLTGDGDIPSSVAAMRLGAEDFLLKTAPKEDLLAAIERALERDAEEREVRARAEDASARLQELSAREREILRRLLRGWMNKQIATELGITERSVKRHRSSLMRKLQTRSVAELTRFALNAGVSLEREAE
jgi:RNA polymerase sigma factor (sigma-70 family)